MDPYRASRAERSSALLKSLGNRAFWNACAVRRVQHITAANGGLSMLKDFRCGHCKRLLARVGENTELQIKCSRCGTLNHVKAVSLESSPLSDMNAQCCAQKHRLFG